MVTKGFGRGSRGQRLVDLGVGLMLRQIELFARDLRQTTCSQPCVSWQ